MVFPVIMYGCESWTVKRAEHWRTDAFELWCWRRLNLESPLDCKEIQLVHSEGDQPWDFFGRNDAKAEPQYFGHLMRRVDSLEKTLMLGGIGGQEEKGTTEDEMAGWHHWLNGHEFVWTPEVGDGQEGLVCAIHGVAKSQTLLRAWTELNWNDIIDDITWYQKFRKSNEKM